MPYRVLKTGTGYQKSIKQDLTFKKPLVLQFHVLERDEVLFPSSMVSSWGALPFKS